jgi:hypothetical protein
VQSEKALSLSLALSLLLLLSSASPTAFHLPQPPIFQSRSIARVATDVTAAIAFLAKRRLSRGRFFFFFFFQEEKRVGPASATDVANHSVVSKTRLAFERFCKVSRDFNENALILLLAAVVHRCCCDSSSSSSRTDVDWRGMRSR